MGRRNIKTYSVVGANHEFGWKGWTLVRLEDNRAIITPLAVYSAEGEAERAKAHLEERDSQSPRIKVARWLQSSYQ